MAQPFPIHLAVVGCGYWGPNLLRNFRTLPQSRVLAMCDRNRERLDHLQALYPEIQPAQDFNDLLHDERIDAIAIATPVASHFELAKASLLAGKHTLVEKPLARSSQQCQELIDIARDLGLTLMAGHTYVYAPTVRKIREIILKGEIGELLYISSNRSSLGVFQKDINVAWDLAPHDLSIILYLMGQYPLSLNCLGQAHVTPGVPDVTNMGLHFPNGRCALLHHSWLSPQKIREMTIVGSKKMIVFDDLEPSEKVKIYDTRVELPPHYDTFAEFQCSYHYGDRYVPYLKQEEPLRVECQHFLNCIRQGTTPLSDGHAGAALVRLLEAATVSLAQSGATVSLTEPLPAPPHSDPVLPAPALRPLSVPEEALAGVP